MNTLQEALSKSMIKNAKKHIVYNYSPKTKDELIKIINDRIKKEGNNCDLNDIDVSNIKDMCQLFSYSNFNGDISKWDVSNVKYMSHMFVYSEFNGNISNWVVSNVISMSFMFAHSNFNGDLSNWDVNKVQYYEYFADQCPIENTKKLPKFK